MSEIQYNPSVFISQQLYKVTCEKSAIGMTSSILVLAISDAEAKQIVEEYLEGTDFSVVRIEPQPVLRKYRS